jgi:hypothetical protein
MDFSHAWPQVGDAERIPPRLLPNHTRRARIQGLPSNSRYGGPAGRVDFWFGQGARASLRAVSSASRRPARHDPSPSAGCRCHAPLTWVAGAAAVERAGEKCDRIRFGHRRVRGPAPARFFPTTSPDDGGRDRRGASRVPCAAAPWQPPTSRRPTSRQNVAVGWGAAVPASWSCQSPPPTSHRQACCGPPEDAQVDSPVHAEKVARASLPVIV